MDYIELKKDDCGAYFSSIKEANHHFDCALNDYLGEIVYRGATIPYSELNSMASFRIQRFIESKIMEKKS